MEEPLNAGGISTFRFDFFGHGESEGRFEQITVSEAVRDSLAAVKYVRETGYRRIGLVGSSFGGLAAILASPQVPGLCFLALKSPVSDHISRLFINRNGHDLKAWKKTGYIQIPDVAGCPGRLNYGFFEDAERVSGYDVARRIGAPTLIVHGGADESVPVGQSVKLASLIPNCRLEILEDADHRYSLDTDFDEMMCLLREFILTHAIST